MGRRKRREMERKREREGRPRKEEYREKREWRGRLWVRLANLRGSKDWDKRRRVSATPERGQWAEDYPAVAVDYPEGQFQKHPGALCSKDGERCVCVRCQIVCPHILSSLYVFISAYYHPYMLQPMRVTTKACYHHLVWYYICMPSHIHVITVSAVIYACHHPCIFFTLAISKLWCQSSCNVYYFVEISSFF